MKTHQETFNQCVEGLASQDFQQALNSAGTKCVYLNDRGHKCAAGHLLSNLELLLLEDAEFSVCGIPAGGCLFRGLHAAGFAPDHDPELVAHLQNAHDTAFPNNMKESLRIVARRFGLQIPEVLRD